MSFNNNIKKWIEIDNEIKNLNKTLKEKREEKNTIIKNIIDYKNSNNLTNTIIKTNKEYLKFINNKQYNPLTYSYIKFTLEEIIDDKHQIDIIIKYLKEKRPFKLVEDIKRICI